MSANRQATLDGAYAAHLERFPRGRPIALRLPTEVGINLPRPSAAAPTPAPPTPVPSVGALIMEASDAP